MKDQISALHITKRKGELLADGLQENRDSAKGNLAPDKLQLY